jgi:hypothetical protein
MFTILLKDGYRRATKRNRGKMTQTIRMQILPQIHQILKSWNILGLRCLRAVEDKEDVSLFYKTLPPRTLDTNKGFLPGAVQKFKGEVDSVLSRVLTKLNDPRSKRTDRKAYSQEQIS